MARWMPQQNPHRVVLADQSLKLQELARPLFRTPSLVLAAACRFTELVDAVLLEKPDIILMDFASGVGEGLTAIEEVMANRPTPILAMNPQGRADPEIFKALEKGALDLVDRPKQVTD